MQLTPYRMVLALSGVRPLLVLSTLARVPVLAGNMVLTLYVVLDLGLGFGAAGTVFGAAILGVRSVSRCWAGSSTGTGCARWW